MIRLASTVYVDMHPVYVRQWGLTQTVGRDNRLGGKDSGETIITSVRQGLLEFKSCVKVEVAVLGFPS